MKTLLKVLLLILGFLFLLLNKNTLLGFLLLLAIVGLYVVLYKFTNLNKLLILLLALILYGVTVYLTWPPYKRIPAVSNSNPKRSEIVETKYGRVQGVLNNDESVAIYAGVPYARAPIGDLRWKKPLPPKTWPGTLVTDRFPNRSMQETNLPIMDSITRIVGYNDFDFSKRYIEQMSEDCLYLNIFKPNNDSKNLPVYVYVHGGSLTGGSGSFHEYNGESLAKEDIIFITINYRLGVFGFLADEELMNESDDHTTGNYGFLDVIQALKWVKENVGYFGGNPDNVTVGGESAGSVLVSALCTSPLAEGLFNRVVLESSTLASVNPPHSYRSLEAALKQGQAIKEKYNVSSIDELRNIPAEQLLADFSNNHHLTVDGYALLENPYYSYQKGIHNEEAILHGANSQESGPFIIFEQANLNNYREKLERYFGEYTDDVLKIFPAETNDQAKENWATIYGAVFFNYPHYCLNRLAVKNNIPVYEYYFSKDNKALGPWHSGEMIYLYHNIPENSGNYNDTDRKLSDTMSSYLISYIKSGNPNNSNNIEWPINTDSKTLLKFDSNVEIVEEKLVALYEILDKISNFEE